ncbi:glycosyltransferase family 2 protein, partial [Bacillus sp. SS-TM]
MMNEKNLPLVSILIPTYNRPHYFKIALESALAQTYSNIEIIIGDDSTNDETATLIREQYLPNYKNITYIRNTPTLGQFLHVYFPICMEFLCEHFYKMR